MLLNFHKVGVADWTAWHRGKHYVVTKRQSPGRPEQWLLAVDGEKVDTFDTEGAAKEIAHAMASTPGRIVRSSLGAIDRKKAFGDATKETMSMAPWMSHVIDLAHVSEDEVNTHAGRARVQSWYTAGEPVWMAADALRRFVENGRREVKASADLDFLRGHVKIRKVK